MVVSDRDLGDNARYSLAIRSNDRRATDWFDVEPAEAHGRTPVVVRLKDNSGLDYDSGVRQVQFTIAAYVQTKEVIRLACQNRCLTPCQFLVTPPRKERNSKLD